MMIDWDSFNSHKWMSYFMQKACNQIMKLLIKGSKNNSMMPLSIEGR